MSFSRLVLGAMLAGATLFGVTALAQSNTDQNAQAPQATATSPATATNAANPAHHRAAHHRAAAAAMVDLNSADAATLAKVRGLNAKRAQAIVAYRAKNGNFQSINDLRNITNAKGKPMFTDRSLKMLAHRLTVGGAAAPATTTTSANQQ